MVVGRNTQFTGQVDAFVGQHGHAARWWHGTKVKLQAIANFAIPSPSKCQPLNTCVRSSGCLILLPSPLPTDR